MPLCKCGCGELCTKNYKRGHGNKVNGPWNKGVKASLEHIKNAIEGRKGYQHSEETKIKIGLGNKGKVRTKEVRKKNIRFC